MRTEIDGAFILYRQVLRFKNTPYHGKDDYRHKENNHIHNHADSDFPFI